MDLVTFGKWFAEQRIAAGFDSQTDLAIASKVDNSTIARIEKGETKASPKTLEKVAPFIKRTYQEMMALLYGASADTPTVGKVPLLGSIRAGVPLISDDNYTETITPPEGVRADFASPVEGDSMIYAGIHPGDIAFFRVASQAHTGQIVAARLLDTDALINLKFYIQKNGQAVLRSANPEYPDIPFSENHAVVGIMTGLIRDGAPVLSDYERLLVNTESITEKWTKALNEAIADGITPEQFTTMLGVLKNFARKGD